MERLIQILLLSTPAATAGPLAAGVEGLVLGLDEAGTLWTGKLGGSGGTWSIQWTEVADQARTEGSTQRPGHPSCRSQRRGGQETTVGAIRLVRWPRCYGHHSGATHDRDYARPRVRPRPAPGSRRS
jgi:hypothetical protein